MLCSTNKNYSSLPNMLHLQGHVHPVPSSSSTLILLKNAYFFLTVPFGWLSWSLMGHLFFPPGTTQFPQQPSLALTTTQCLSVCLKGRGLVFHHLYYIGHIAKNIVQMEKSLNEWHRSLLACYLAMGSAKTIIGWNPQPSVPGSACHKIIIQPWKNLGLDIRIIIWSLP